jgi:DNA replication protein DnaC
VHRCPCTIESKIAAKLPERYRSADLRHFHGPALEAVTEWLKNPTEGLLITGLTGRGKTHLAAAIVRFVVVEKKTGIKFRRCAQFYSDVREMYRTEQSENSLLAPLEQSPFLVLDDLGAGSLSDAERRFTLELIERRLLKQRPTIVTTNWGLQAISEKMDDRIASRLALFTEIELSGEDKRVRR